MADFVAVLTKTIEGLGPRNTVDMRQKVYERARKAIADKLAAVSPPPSPEQAARQYRLLDDAVKTVETRFAPPPVFSPSAPYVAPPAPPAVAAIAPMPSAPKADRDPLEDFLNSVENEPARPLVVAPKVAAQPLQRLETPIPAKPLVGAAHDPVPGLSGSDLPHMDVATSGLARTPKRNGANGLIYAVLAILVIGGAGYAGYLYKDRLQSLLGMPPVAATTPANSQPPAAEPEKPAAEPEKPAAEPAKPAAEAEPAAAQPAKPVETAAAESPSKFTQRLMEDGTEVDVGPGTKPTDVGEGSTVAAATTPSSEAPATPAEAAKPAETVPVGQKAIFYEEKTGTEAGTADQGAVVWSIVQDSPGVDQPEEPAIRGDLTIPDKNIKVRLTIKRNGDKSLPASHIIEMLFSTPPDFAGGAVESVQRMALKDTEQAPGSPLVGVPAAFGDGFFLIALTDEKTAIETNMTLLQRQNWIDVPVAYRSGRRALLSFEKGLAGDKVFKDVFKAWEAKSVAPAAPAPEPAPSTPG